MELIVRPEHLVVSRLDPDAPWPTPPRPGSLFSVTRVDGELSVISTEDGIPPGARTEPGWRAFSVVGTLDFALVGIVASLTAPLADAGLSVFVLSTFDTDHLLIRAADVDRAADVLRSAGHSVS